jgi:hypothetical protein
VVIIPVWIHVSRLNFGPKAGYAKVFKVPLNPWTVPLKKPLFLADYFLFSIHPPNAVVEWLTLLLSI